MCVCVREREGEREREREGEGGREGGQLGDLTKRELLLIVILITNQQPATILRVSALSTCITSKQANTLIDR